MVNLRTLTLAILIPGSFQLANGGGGHSLGNLSVGCLLNLVFLRDGFILAMHLTVELEAYSS